MTTAAQTAAPLPVPTDPGVSLDLSPTTAGANAMRAAAAEASKVQWTGKLPLGPNVYDLVPELTPLDMIELQEAQESGQLRRIIETIPLLVVPDQQDMLRTFLFSRPERLEDRVGFDKVIDALNNGMEQINARP